MQLLSKPDYLEALAASRDARIGWWREARFGMFIHFGLHTLIARNEWAMAIEDFTVGEYEKLADSFCPKPGAPRQWAKLAKEAGMKYMVLTTRHHEGFSLWDSAANPYNSVNYGCHRDIVREFVDACREFDLKIGFYSSLMDWHHPDGGRCAYDGEARKRFTDYIYAINRELLTQYGKIDILWYDVAWPLDSDEGWNTLEINQRLRALQPDIIINNRSRLPEDFGTPEEHLTATEGDWEACMTFNGISWGYLDSAQAQPYSYNAQQILRMLCRVSGSGGNLLLNIGPDREGNVPAEAVAPLQTIGKWLAVNGEAAYGKRERGSYTINGLCSTTVMNNAIYGWFWLWPGKEVTLGGVVSKLKRASFLTTGDAIEFTQDGHRVRLKNMPEKGPDAIANIAVIKLEFDEPVRIIRGSYRPALHKGKEYQPAE
ncbi:MAG: alpha-L-fucosidase [Clostridiales bacterium]|jgi:alpha-L-fucosidase|nr:alpha-L-fucosidase [Clostridiales bacterium]